MERDARLALLAHGEIEVEGRIAASSNQALLVLVRDHHRETRACYKPEAGERPLWDFDEGLWRREVAAYELDRLLGFDLVPDTVARLDAPFGPGSLQWWVDDPSGDHYFTLFETGHHRDWLKTLAVFDVVANNADRKSGHVVFDGTRCWAIDNGLSFHVEDKLRTVIWDFANERIDDETRDTLREFAKAPMPALDALLSANEVKAVRHRATRLAEVGTLPAPDPDAPRPPYPWPLI